VGTVKRIAAFLLLAAMLAFSVKPGEAQDSGYRTITISGTSDVLIDSTLSAASMAGVRCFINSIYAWYDNAANTNQIFVEVVRGQSAVATQGLRRQFKWSKAMTSSGIEGQAFPAANITTGPDSTIYFVINASGSDSLFLAVNYKIVN
jgi:hypothetical protein